MIVKRGNGYGVSVYDPALKRKRWVGTFGTKAEAERLSGGEPSAARRRAADVRRVRELWLTEYPRAAGATRRTYRYALKTFADEFARVRLPTSIG